MKTNDPKPVYRKTKMICTLGPATESVEMITRLLQTGMDVARLNFSHGTQAEHLTQLKNVREAEKIARRPCAIMLDLQGPKIRTGSLQKKEVMLKPGAPFTITSREVAGDERTVSTTYQSLPQDVVPGDSILIDDGSMKLKVLSSNRTDVICEVIDGGILKEHKGMNLPGVRLSAPGLTDKDIADLEFGLSQDIDYIALSFVRRPEDVCELKERMARVGKKVPVISKIEKPEAVVNIERIVEETDGVMVARGDLGVELPSEEVPLVQKKIITMCNRMGKPVITATQMLDSMIEHPRPTRAESNDVANAVLDGSDAVMLSGETSVGKYPVETVAMMAKIILSTESHRTDAEHHLSLTEGNRDPVDALGHAACVIAEQIGAKAIVAVTKTGMSARAISKYRPKAKIVAATELAATIRSMNLIWGVRGLAIDKLTDTDTTFDFVQKELVKRRYLDAGDYVVFIAGIPLLEQKFANMIKVARL